MFYFSRGTRWTFKFCSSFIRSKVIGDHGFSALDLTSEVTGWPRTLSLYTNRFVSRRARRSLFACRTAKHHRCMCSHRHRASYPCQRVGVLPHAFHFRFIRNWQNTCPFCRLKLSSTERESMTVFSNISLQQAFAIKTTVPNILWIESKNDIKTTKKQPQHLPTHLLPSANWK